MGWRRRKVLRFLIWTILISLYSCAAEPAMPPVPKASAAPAEAASPAASLADLAGRERSQGFQPGMGLAESSLRERAGDYPGAVLAAFKELLYHHSLGFLPKQDLLARLDATEAAFPEDPAVAAAVRAARAYLRGDWSDVLRELEALSVDTAAPDDFAPWLLAACRLETAGGDYGPAGIYASLRGRYTRFPPYWYHAARTGRSEAAAEAAEWYVVLAPEGPYAQEARSILAREIGLSSADGSSLRTRAEIEAVLTALASQGESALEILVPLLALPDNPYTLYALGGLRALCADPGIREEVSKKAASGIGGRAAERLRYAAGGIR